MASEKTSAAKHAPKTWLITGGCGFIGRNLIKAILEQEGGFIRVLDDLSTGTRDDLARVCTFEERKANAVASQINPKGASRVELIVGDIRKGETCLQAAQDIQVIVHLAANTGIGPSLENPLYDMEENVLGTLNMLEAARKKEVSRLLFASSGAPAGKVDPPMHEEIAPHPISPYGASKLAGEGYCSAYWGSFGLNTVALRFGNVYGPLSRHKESVISKFINQALNGETCIIYGSGTQTRDFIFTADLVQAMLMAANQEKIAGEIFQIASNKEHTVNEVAEIISKELQEQAGIQFKAEYSRPRPGEVLRNYSDTSKAWKMLGWKANTDLETGIKKTVHWFLKTAE